MPPLKLVAAALLLAFSSQVLSQGAKTSSAVDTPARSLKPGEFVWAPGAAPAGPLVMVISLDEQLAYVYRNGLRIGVSTVSSGKKGKETPTGVFTILQKNKDHKSNLYNSAPMPFMQRLTWDGIALHAGKLPGYPASHGCVRLPYEFARKLFDVTNFSMTVVVADAASQNAEHAHPGVFAPSATSATDVADGPTKPLPGAGYQWNPQKSPTGPLTLLISTGDRRALVLRNGIEIGRSPITVAPGPSLFGTQAYVLLSGDTATPSRIVPGRAGKNWQSVPMPGYTTKAGASIDSEATRRVSVPPAFAQLVYDQLVPGATLVLTDAPVLPKTTGQPMTVITAEEEETQPAPPTTEAPSAK